MHTKPLIWIGLFIGSTIGGALPLIWGGSALSFSSVILSALGGIAGIYAGLKLTNY